MSTAAWLDRLKGADSVTWAVRIVLALVAGGLLLWSGLNALHSPVPPALWTPGDLPAAPEAAENGWQLLRDHQHDFRGVPTGAVDQQVRAALAASGATAAPDRAAMTAADEQFSAPSVQRLWTLCDGAFASVEFVDACPLDYASRCPSLELRQCHRLASYRVLQHAARGLWADAAQQLEQLLGPGGSHLRSARSVVSMLVALRNQHSTLVLAGRLQRWARAAGAEADLAPLRASLASAEPTRAALDPAIISEYLRQLHGAVLIQRGEIEGEGVLPGFFFNAGATIGELNRIYRPVREASGLPAMPATRYTDPVAWWLVNPLGKLYLDAVLLPPRVFSSLAQARAELLAQQEQIRVRYQVP